MANNSILKISRSFHIDSTSIPPLFLAPALQSLRLSSPLRQSQPQTHPFSTTPCTQARVRNREENKSRGVSAIRRTGPRVPLSISKYPLPMPVYDPPLRKEFKTREDHGLWAFFNEERTAMTTPEDLNAHGRSWTYAELANKHWNDLWKIWWMCVKERNWLETEALERKRRKAGYGDYEGEHRMKTIQNTMRGIRKVLTHRSQSFEAALKTTGTVEFWKETLTQKKQDERGSWLEALEDDNDEENFEEGDKMTQEGKARTKEQEQEFRGMDGASSQPQQLLRQAGAEKKEAGLR